MSDPIPPTGPCGACPVDRRSFLRFSGATLLAALLAEGLPLDSLAAAPGPVSGRTTDRGDEIRYPIPAADAVQIDRDNDVILVRHTGHLYAFDLSCPHQNTALRWVEEDGGRFQCPKHKSRYTPEGTYISGRATRSMDRFTLRRDGTEVAVNLDQLWRQDQHPAEWAAAELSL